MFGIKQTTSSIFNYIQTGMIGPGSLVWNKSIVWFYIPTSSTPLKCELRLFWTRSVNFCLFWIRVSWSRSRVLTAEFTKTPVITLSTCTTIYLCIWYIHLSVHLSESTPQFICPCFHPCSIHGSIHASINPHHPQNGCMFKGYSIQKLPMYGLLKNSNGTVK